MLGRWIVVALIAGTLFSCRATNTQSETKDTVLVGIDTWMSGVPYYQMEYFAAPQTAGRQRSTNWCWAASVQMVLNFHGVVTSQEAIVQRAFGMQVDIPGSVVDMARGLNGWQVNALGGYSMAYSYATVQLDLQEILLQLAANRPFVVGLNNPPPAEVGHARAVTGIVYHRNPWTGQITPLQVHMRDPWPGSPSYEVMTWDDFASRFNSAIYISVAH